VLWKPLKALLNIPSKIGVTATLNVQYKKPTKADQVSCSPLSKASGRLADMGRKFIVVRTELDSIAGRKVNVSGSIESLDGEILATAQYVCHTFALIFLELTVFAELSLLSQSTHST
jgi:hypothetical protein